MKISRNVELQAQVGKITLLPPVLDDVQKCYDAILLSMAEIMPRMNLCQADYSIDLTIN
jgi:hypothetical protein